MCFVVTSDKVRSYLLPIDCVRHTKWLLIFVAKGTSIKYLDTSYRAPSIDIQMRISLGMCRDGIMIKLQEESARTKSS